MPASNTEIAERISALAGPVVADAGAELVDVEVKGTRGSQIVRIVADADDGLDLDLIADLSRDIGDLLDERELVDGRYTLEVSSPGVDRPLRSTRQFRRNVGRDVRVVRTRDAIDRGEKGEVTGALADVQGEDAEATLVLDLGKAGELHVPVADVDHGKVVLPW